MINFYGSSQIGNSIELGEIDLRKELHTIIWDEGRGIYFLYRKVQFENGVPKKCPCWNTTTLEPDIDTQCRVCKGLGYFFTDYIVRGHKSLSQGYSITKQHKDYGIEPYEYRTFYLEYNSISSQSGNNFDIPSPYDKLIEVSSDINGTIESPLRSLIKYDIISVDPYRLDHGGRIEFYRIRARAAPEGSYLV